MKFSVLLSVYKKEKPAFLKKAIESILQQTLLPNEIVIVEDGRLTDELYQILDYFENSSTDVKVKRIAFQDNRGLGLALRDGVLACDNDYIARMDTDDISLPTRFEKEIGFLLANPQCDMVGSWIMEFETDSEKPDSLTMLPETCEAIKEYAKSRNPFRHMTVIYKKEAVLKSGNYRDFPLFEDYDLWVRMLKEGYELANIPECLVLVRADKDMFARRGGLKYIIKEINFQRFLYESEFIGIKRLMLNIALRTTLRIVPNKLREWMYKIFLRRSVQ